MHIKWLRYGAGDARKATAYVLAKLDHQGIERAGVKVLRGNTEQVAQMANSLAFSRCYSSGVIAWAKEDAPTPAQIQQALDGFAQVAFSGMEDRVVWTAVQHTEADGSVHVHVLVARVDLETGKAFNPAPPGWEKSYDPLRDTLNYENGWARPDDPARARLVQPGHQALIDAAALRKGLTTPTAAKEQITDWLVQRVEAGLVNDRAGVRASLAELGEITREGADYLSVKPAGFDKAIRLKGPIYGEKFSGAGLAAGREDGQRPGADRGADERAATAARRDLAAAIERRREYNKGRYRTAASGADRQPERLAQAERAASSDAGSGNESPAAGAGSRNDEADEAPAVADALADLGGARYLPADLRADLGLLEAGQPDDEHWQLRGDEGRRLDNMQHRDTAAAAEPALSPFILDTLRGGYDRIRTAVSDRIRTIVDRIRGAFERARQRDQQLVTACIGFVAASHGLEQTARAAEQRSNECRQEAEGGLLICT